MGKARCSKTQTLSMSMAERPCNGNMMCRVVEWCWYPTSAAKEVEEEERIEAS
jgi:hypothetical protein